MIEANKRKKLNEYAKLCNDELGEFCEMLVNLGFRLEIAITDELEKAIEDEIDAQIDNFETYSRIVEREEVLTVKHVELEWDWV